MLGCPFLFICVGIRVNKKTDCAAMFGLHFPCVGLPICLYVLYIRGNVIGKVQQ